MCGSATAAVFLRLGGTEDGRDRSRERRAPHRDGCSGRAESGPAIARRGDRMASRVSRRRIMKWRFASGR